MSVELKSRGRDGFDAVYTEYKDLVVQTIALYVDNHSIAEDIAQDAFLRYYLYVEHHEVEHAKAWIMTTAKNLAINYIRDHKKEMLCDMTCDNEEIKSFMEGPETVFFEKLWKAEVFCTTKSILCALEKKNERWFDAITLVYGMEQSQKDVAKRLGMSCEGLQSMLYRAKNWIKKHIEMEIDHK